MMWTITNAGGGTSAAGGGTIANNRPGQITHNVTGVATPDRTAMHAGLANGGSILVGGGVITLETSVKHDTLSDAVDAFSHRCGLGDTSTGADQVDGIYFEGDRNVHGNNQWRGVVASNSVRTRLDLGVAPTAGTFTKLRFVVAADGSSVEFFVDDVSRGTITGGLPTGAGRQVGLLLAQVVKTVGTTLRTVRTDYFEVTQTFTAARNP